MKTHAHPVFRAVVLMCLTALYLSSAYSQKQLKMPYLKGIVADFVTSSRISDASILIEETQTKLTSNANGEFEIEDMNPGVYTIRIDHPLHRPLLYKNFQMIGDQGDRAFGKHQFFTLKSGSKADPPFVCDGTPLGQFVIDEDAEITKRRDPVYPESALREKAEGTVLLWVGVDKEGEVSYAWPKEGSKRNDLIEAAKDAAQYFKFKPAKVKGKPVSVMVTVPFNFKLADKSTPYPLDHLDGPLTSDDVEQALAYLGVELERFAYELPYKHKVKFWVEQYRDGKLADTKSGLITPQPGRCSILIIKHQYTDSIRYTLNVASGNGRRTMIFGNIPIRGYNASGTQRMTDIALRSGVKVPIYLYALSPEGVSFNFGDPIDRIIARIKLVIVISVELNLQ
jgi:TonB family protein